LNVALAPWEKTDSFIYKDEVALYWSLASLLPLKPYLSLYTDRLHSLLRSSYFKEPRKGVFGKFFDKSKTRAAKQSIQCRLECLRLINQPWNDANLSKNSIIIAFYSYRKQLITFD